MQYGFKHRWGQLWTLLFVGFGINCPLWAGVDILILDQNHQPVENAVVDLDLEQFHNSEALALQVEKNTLIDQIDHRFVPFISLIAQDQSVHFPNSDQTRHHVYSFSKPKPFEIKLYKGSPQLPVLFDQPGVVVLGCNIHDQMVGYVYVAPRNHWAALSDDKGMVTLPMKLGSDEIEIRLWHWRQQQGTQAMDLQISRNDKGLYQASISLNAPSKSQVHTFGDYGSNNGMNW